MDISYSGYGISCRGLVTYDIHRYFYLTPARHLYQATVPPPIPLVKESGSSFRSESGSEGRISFFRSESGSEGRISFGSYPSSCAGSSHSIDTEDITMPPTPRMTTALSTDTDGYIRFVAHILIAHTLPKFLRRVECSCVCPGLPAGCRFHTDRMEMHRIFGFGSKEYILRE